MILKIRNSQFGKGVSLSMIALMLFTIVQPTASYALTGGAAQPEFNSFTPIGTSDMVDLASGDFNYNIPIMDIGGFPINLAYKSGVTMDQEASWVGLGWDLSIGQINRQMRGLPDDFKRDEMLYENNIKDNWTIGASFKVDPALFGASAAKALEAGKTVDGSGFTIGLSGQYNSYNGMSMSPSAGISSDQSKVASVGLNVSSGPDGLVVSPNASLNAKYGTDSKRDHMNALKSNVGLSFNSRQGLTSVNMSASSSAINKATGKKAGTSGSIGSAISYVPNTYTPSVQSNILNLSGTFNAAIGTEAYGVEGNGQITAFTSTQVLTNKEETQYAYGYENTHIAGKNDVLDFNREKDGNFSANSTNLPITNYTHDIYSVQGQGVSGMFRPYRSQVGYVYDNNTYSTSVGGALGLEFGAGGTAHVGVDVEVTTTIGESGLWGFKNNALNSFKSTPPLDQLYEEVYFKNVGDLSVDDEIGIYGTKSSNWGQYSPLHLEVVGEKYKRELHTSYNIKHESLANTYYPSPLSPSFIKRSQRVRRNQNMQQITAKEAEIHNLLGFTRHAEAKDHHTAGFVVTRNDGARYVYGKALYNTTKKEATFALGEGIGGATAPHEHTGNCEDGLIDYTPDKDNSIKNKHGDHYFNRVTTPAYAHTFLLSTLLSTDYADLSGDGPSDDDLGSYTKFTYTDNSNYNWRVPFQQNKANFNEGLKTDPTDDKGSYVYGEKELSYIKEIETKTHIAIFHISERFDAHGVSGEDGGYGAASSMSKLDKISLYSKGEYGTPGAIPIKEAHFKYNYSLCNGIPNNENPDVDNRGKLTLEKVYFTYRNSNMGKYSPYEFHYDNDNPSYNLKAYDVWGNYKENPITDCSTLSALSTPEFNYIDQNDPTQVNTNVAAWTMSSITLPSGGEIKIDLEADDYQYVQDKKAMRMFKLVGAGDHRDPFHTANNFEDPSLTDGEVLEDEEALLYKGTKDADYLYFELDAADAAIDATQFRAKYLSEIYERQKGLLQFRMLMNMTPAGGLILGNWDTKPFDYVTGYAELDDIANSDIFIHDGKTYGSVHVKTVKMEGGLAGGAMVSPFAKAGWNFARKYLANYVYGLPALDEGSGAAAAVEAVVNAVENLVEIFTGPNALLKGKKVARRFIPHKSWIRLSNPTDQKLGGGCRVKQIVMADGWHNMIGEPEESPSNQKYGQEYTYTLEDGSSSGVATYEPVGSKENPFVQPSFVNVNRVLAPDEENYIEKPFGESFFPNPTVTYSRVTVKNLERIDEIDPNIRVRSNATGEVITEFFTSKDYPTITDQTNLEVDEDHNPLLSGFLNINVRKHLTLTQGYVVHLNDMNGKMKSQRVYAEGQDAAISGVDYVYDAVTPENPEGLGVDEDFVLLASNGGKIDNTVRTLHPDGTIRLSTLGVEYDIINDFREKRSETETIGVNANLATFIIGVIPGLVPVPLPDLAFHEDKLNMSVTTKVINTFGILREVVAHDAGASVSTRNLLWDAHTGEVLVTQTLNEYGDKYYSFNYPAHWAYEGMGMASSNSGVLVSVEEIDATTGTYQKVGGGAAAPHFYAGDEVLVNSASGASYAWVTEITGASISLQDEIGEAVNITDDEFTLKVVRSGKRNLQSTSMGSIVMMDNPIDIIQASGGTIPGDFLITSDHDEYKIVNAGAVEFSDEWEPPCECAIDTQNDTYNKYLYNAKGVWRADKSWLYLTGRHQETGEATTRDDGFYNSFYPFYSLGGSGWQTNETDWTFTSQVTKFSPYGFELENEDALGRKSAAQYGYNHSFPMAVGANSAYQEMGFDGFEDYRNFDGCLNNEHFGFREGVDPAIDISSDKSHTGRFSLKVNAGERMSRIYNVDCR